MNVLDEAEAGSSFNKYTVPLMTLALKQGFGRLIRRTTDRGVVAILDERLSNRRYGNRARRDLPPARFSRQVRDVHQFYRAALGSKADFALNVSAAIDEETEETSWRWQLVRLQDGKSDRPDLRPGRLQSDSGSGDSSCAGRDPQSCATVSRAPGGSQAVSASSFVAVRRRNGCLLGRQSCHPRCGLKLGRRMCRSGGRWKSLALRGFELRINQQSDFAF